MSMSTLSLPQTLRPVPRNVLAAQPDASVVGPSIRRITSQLLLDGERELVIQHLDSEYHLRLTRNGKLILTK
jgi:hemin uptake protein HemP